MVIVIMTIITLSTTRPFIKILILMMITMIVIVIVVEIDIVMLTVYQ